MSLRDVLFSSKGRIPRSTWWYFNLVMFGVSVLAYIIIYSSRSVDVAQAISCIMLIFSLVMLYPSIMVNIKRFHDRDRSGNYLLWSYIPTIIYIGLILIMVVGASSSYRYGYGYLDPYSYGDYITPGTGFTAVLMVIDLVILMVGGCWVFVELAFVSGTRGPNIYGPDPLQPQSARGVQLYQAPPQPGYYHPAVPPAAPPASPPAAPFMAPPMGAQPAPPPVSSGIKSCPYCGETISAEAAYCKFCGKAQS